MVPNNRRFNVLCLSGGGYRGLYSATLLRKLEEAHKVERLADHFDLIIGTSTGALIAAGVASGLKASRIEHIFRTSGKQIFPKLPAATKIYRNLRFFPRYRTEPLINTIKEIFPKTYSTPVRALPYKLGIVALSEIDRSHVVIKGGPYSDHASTNISLEDALLATTAAPTYFLAKSTNNPSNVFVDGGLVANAPVLLGVQLVRQKWQPPLEKIYVLHVGTAGVAERRSFKSPKKKNWLGRALNATRDLVDLTISAQEALAADVARTLLGERYVPLDLPPGTAPLIELDDASDGTTKDLDALAERAWAEAFKDVRVHRFFPVMPPA